MGSNVRRFWLGVESEVFSTQGIMILIGVVERFMSITDGFVANSTFIEEREHKMVLSLLDSRTIGFDKSP